MVIKNIKKELLSVYNNLVDIIEIRKDLYEVELPLFLNTGDMIDIQISYKKNHIILKNSLYKRIEEAIGKEYPKANLKKDYFLNEKKFISLKKSLLEKKIERNLLLEKKISKELFEENYVNEIFQYSFEISRYYNYIYDYLIENLKSESKLFLFNNEIKNFVDNFNKNNKEKFSKIEKNEIEIISTYNQYYKSESFIITGINSKVHLWEAISDLEVMKKINKDSKTFILIDNNKKIDIAPNYLEKIIDSEKDLNFYLIEKEKSLEDFSSILKENEN